MVAYLMLAVIAVLAFLCVSAAIPEMMTGAPPRRPSIDSSEETTPQE
jgi:hypothetical protein